jgi:hypothetical protein
VTPGLSPLEGGDTLLRKGGGAKMSDKRYPDVWEFTENAPGYAENTADLWHWSTNYAAGQGPITLFLDLIGYTEEEYGERMYNFMDNSLGYVELSKLADALREYADRPTEVMEWVRELLSYEDA